MLCPQLQFRSGRVGVKGSNVSLKYEKESDADILGTYEWAPFELSSMEKYRVVWLLWHKLDIFNKYDVNILKFPD